MGGGVDLPPPSYLRDSVFSFLPWEQHIKLSAPPAPCQPGCYHASCLDDYGLTLWSYKLSFRIQINSRPPSPFLYEGTFQTSDKND